MGSLTHARLRRALMLGFGAFLLIALASNVAVAQVRELSPQARTQIQALMEEKASRTATEQKISSQLLMELRRRQGDPIVLRVPNLRYSVEVAADGTTLVDIRADVTVTLLNRIRQLGGSVVNSFPQYRAVRARVPIEELVALAGSSSVDFIRQADQLMLHKVNTSEGDVAHRADVARTQLGIDGTGAKVCAISDSIDSLAALQASGDLPPVVDVLPGQSGNPGSSEGTAMLEIIYDLAPGADLGFATAFGGEAQFAQNILDLRSSAGCDVIVDDVSYFAEAVFQDGIIAQAVETVVADGAFYFSSAGNSGNLNDSTSGVWEGDFVPGADLGSMGISHDFGGGNLNPMTADAPSVITLQWSDPMGGSNNDYDLYVVDPAGTTILAFSDNAQTGTQDPFEGIGTSGVNDTGNYLLISKFSGSGRFLHLNTNRGRLIGTSGQTSGHSAAVGAFSVAAVDIATASGGAFTGGGTNPVETFSSDGPRRVFYQANGTAITPGNFSSTGGALRQKPDIAAADGVATATPGFNPFHGTSAAAPHAAAIVGLAVEVNPNLTLQQVRSGFVNTSLDIEAAGVDRDSGYGIIDALAFLQSVVSSFRIFIF